MQCMSEMVTQRNLCGLDVRSKSAELLPGPWRGASPEVPGICNSTDVCFAGQRNDEEKFLGHLFPILFASYTSRCRANMPSSSETTALRLLELEMSSVAG